MFYVYCGYVSADNCDASEGPIYEFREFSSAAGVLTLKKEFDEEIHEDCSHVIFRVIEGTERKFVEKKPVIEWELE